MNRDVRFETYHTPNHIPSLPGSFSIKTVLTRESDSFGRKKTLETMTAAIHLASVPRSAPTVKNLELCY